MELIAGLMIFSAGGTWLSARHRAAVPAVVFAVLATALFITTPLGHWVPGAVSWTADTVSSVGGRLASVGGAR